MISAPLMLVIGVTLAGLLSVFGVLQWRRLCHRRRRLLAEALAAAERRERAQASIEVLARCVVQDQVSLVEAAIRISTLAQGLGQDTDRALYKPFDDLARAAAHIPVLDAWQRLSRAERTRFTQQLDELEQRHSAALKSASSLLLVRQ